MKKILNLMITFVCVLSCAVIFSGCDIFHNQHITSEDWIMNSTYHWHECEDCGNKIDKAEHDWERIVLIEQTATEDEIAYYICKGCGMQLVDTFHVTEQEWNVALNLNDFNKLTITAQVDDKIQILAIDDDIVHNHAIVGEEYNEYFSNESDNYYNYYQESNTWIKTKITKEDYEWTRNGFDLLGQFAEDDIYYSDFVYDEDLRAYKYAEEAEWNEGEIYTRSWTLHFEKGRLIKMLIVNGVEQGLTITYTFKYDNPNLELPQQFSTTLMYQEIWDFALDLRNYDKVKISNSSGNITKDGDIIYYDIDSENYGYYEYIEESQKYYHYKLVNQIWTKEEISSYKYYLVGIELNINIHLSEKSITYLTMSYNSQLSAYEASLEDDEIDSVKLYFEYGRLIKYEQIKDNLSNVTTMEYDNIELELPTIG